MDSLNDLEFVVCVLGMMTLMYAGGRLVYNVGLRRARHRAVRRVVEESRAAHPVVAFPGATHHARAMARPYRAVGQKGVSGEEVND